MDPGLPALLLACGVVHQLLGLLLAQHSCVSEVEEIKQLMYNIYLV